MPVARLAVSNIKLKSAALCNEVALALREIPLTRVSASTTRVGRALAHGRGGNVWRPSTWAQPRQRSIDSSMPRGDAVRANVGRRS